MKPAGETRRYELIPFRMVVPGISVPADGALPDAAPEDRDECCWPPEFPIVGIWARPTCPERARRQAEELLRHCRHRLRSGDREAVLDLLDLNPEFICVPWVRDELLRSIEGGLPLRRRGRPRGRYKMHPLVVVGLVEHLIGTGQVPNREQAFLKLYELRVIGYESARECYYRGLREKRFEAVLMEFPELRRVIAEEEASALLQAAELVRPGKRSVRRWMHPRLGTAELVVRGDTG